MSNDVPLLNEYKRKYLWKRLPQTTTGGLKLKLDTKAPCYVYLIQILLFFMPLVICIPLAFVADDSSTLHQTIFASACGISVAMIVIILQNLTWFRTKNNNTDPPPASNLLSDEDELEFTSICAKTTLEFSIPHKRYVWNIYFHALVSAVLIALAFLMLLPNRLCEVFPSITVPGCISLFVFSWIVVCISQYPLSTISPPEPATYNMQPDLLETNAIMRAFYVVLLAAVTLVTSHWVDDVPLKMAANKVMYASFLLLPVLWFTGVLPPLKAFLLWLLEQVHVFVFGGSYMASFFRMAFMIVLTLIAVSISTAVAIVDASATIFAIGASGFVLSLDLIGFSSKLLQKKCNRQTWKELAVCCFMGGLAVTAIAIPQYISSIKPTLKDTKFGFSFVLLMLMILLLRNCQHVMVLFGHVRNKLYPTLETMYDAEELITSKTTLNYIGQTHRHLLNYVSPVLMIMYLASSNLTEIKVFYDGGYIAAVMNIILILRAFRWVWQNTNSCLIELSVLSFLETFGTNAMKDNRFILLAIISFAWDRLMKMKNMIFFATSVLITSWTYKKMLRDSALQLIIVNVFVIPITLIVFAIASCLSAPLFPLFTLPIFFLAFPRTNRFWPSNVGESGHQSGDSVFYHQCTPLLCANLKKTISFGRLGAANPGSHYLVRFQDRLLWLFVLEKGYSFITLGIKGLELQETSCHTVEAAGIDSIFESSFQNKNSYLKPSLNTLTPLDAMVINTYSDARNVLTGIIDSPEYLEMVAKEFPRTLLWVVMHHCHKTGKPSEETNIKVKIKSGKVFPADIEKPSSTTTSKHTLPPLPKGVTNLTTIVPIDNSEQRSTFDEPLDISHGRPKSNLKEYLSSETPVQNILFSDWDDSDTDDTDDNPPKLHMQDALKSHMHAKAKLDERASNLEKNSVKMGNFQDICVSDDDKIELSESFHEENIKSSFPRFSKHRLDNVWNNSEDLSIQHISLLSNDQEYPNSDISLPVEWRTVVIDRNLLQSICAEFPKDWYHFLTENLSGIHSTTVKQNKTSVLETSYMQLVMTVFACYYKVDLLGKPTEMGPSYLFKCWSGKMLENQSTEWLISDKILFTLAQKAYRYAVKLAYDQMVFGEVLSNTEAAERLADLDGNWYLGEENSDWETNIRNNHPKLFSIGYNAIEKIYTGHILTKQPMVVCIGALNAEAVKAIWASLNFELLYLTNDDDERYSIQAHPTLLRNLTIQAADPPLGYPIFSSPPISFSIA